MNKEQLHALKNVVEYAQRELHKKKISKSFSRLLDVNIINDWIRKQKEHKCDLNCDLTCDKQSKQINSERLFELVQDSVDPDTMNLITELIENELLLEQESNI